MSPAPSEIRRHHYATVPLNLQRFDLQADDEEQEVQSLYTQLKASMLDDLSEKMKAVLRQWCEDTVAQVHFRHSSMAVRDAATGAKPPVTGIQHERWRRQMDMFEKRCQRYADPIPSKRGWLDGYLDRRSWLQNVLPRIEQPVVAEHSKKVHYQSRLLNDYFPENPDNCHKFLAELPYVDEKTNAVHLMSEAQWQAIASEQQFQSKTDYIKHVLNLRDGEIRVINDQGFQPQPLAWDEATNLRLWPYQSARVLQARRVLWSKEFGHDKLALTWRDVKWLVGKTSLWQWDYSVRDPRDEDYLRLLIRQGNMITLSEVLWQAKDCVSLYDAYVYYTTLPTLIAKKRHSRSFSRQQTLRRNANLWRKHDRTAATGAGKHDRTAAIGAEQP